MVIIFRTQSDIEASVVRGLLETHGIRALLASDVSHTVFPLTINGLGEVRLSVRRDEALAAKRLIGEYRYELETEVGRIQDKCDSLEQALNYHFHDKGLLEHALTHSSRVHDDQSKGVVDNESLEFLGDAVLGFVVSDRLFREFPEYDEGRKSKAKALLVSAPTLATLGEELGLGHYLLLGRGEEKTGGRQKPSLIADTFEAIVAAIYLDGGIKAAEIFLEGQFREAFEEIRAGRMVSGGAADYKSALQEWLQSKNQPLPHYSLVGERGPEHRKLFEIEVRVGEEVVGQAEGHSKKQAEQKAADCALKALKNPN